jgi:CPA1 family monovalent cation:H+ antiporter
MTDATMLHHVEVQILLLLLVAACVGMVARRFRLPYTLALVVAGLTLGGFDLQVLHDVELNAELLLLLLLPALLFEAAFHIDITEFRRNLAPIVMLAVPGVMLASSACAAILYFALGASGLVEGFGWREAWLFSVVMAATDPVSVLALFRQFGVAKRLYLVVEGESLLNDGVAVVLFVVVTGVYGLGAAGNAMPEDVSLLGYGLETLLRMGGGGLLVGAAMGGAFTVLTRQIDDHLIETTLSVLLAYGSFLAAEQLHCSGVLSTVFAGIIAGAYGTRWGMSALTHNAVEDFWEFAAFLANSFIFLLVGLELEPWRLWHDGLAIVVAFVAVALGRAVAVYLGVPVADRMAMPLPTAWRHVMMWGGLRGSLSMVLVLTLPAGFTGRTLLVTMVFGVVGLSLFIQGLTMGPLLERLGLLKGKHRHDAYERARTTSIMTRRALEELSELEHDGLVEEQVASRLRTWYQDRNDRASADAKSALGAAQISEQIAETVRRLAEAERRGVREAERAEIVDVDVAARLEAELVLRLVALNQVADDPERLAAAVDDLLRVDSRAVPVAVTED